jgi:hypothetical protein
LGSFSSCLAALSFVSCGGSKSADDIARSIDEAIEATTVETSQAERARISDAQVESAADEVACDAIGAYGSEPAQALQDQLEAYAARQQVASGYGLSQVDADAADRLAAAADGIETSQDAGEVLDELAC